MYEEYICNVYTFILIKSHLGSIFIHLFVYVICHSLKVKSLGLIASIVTVIRNRLHEYTYVHYV